MALILRWHIRYPAHIISNGNAATRLRSALTDAINSTPTLTWTGSPDTWTDAHETALLDGLIAQAASGVTANFTYLSNWPSWLTGTNPRNYALAAPVAAALSTTRDSFDFDDGGLPPGEANLPPCGLPAAAPFRSGLRGRRPGHRHSPAETPIQSPPSPQRLWQRPSRWSRLRSVDLQRPRDRPSPSQSPRREGRPFACRFLPSERRCLGSVPRSPREPRALRSGELEARRLAASRLRSHHSACWTQPGLAPVASPRSWSCAYRRPRAKGRQLSQDRAPFERL